MKGKEPGSALGAAVAARSSTRGAISAERMTAVDLWIIMSVPLVWPFVPRKVGPVVCCDEVL